MAMKRTIRRGLASPAICWGLGIWTAVGCVLSAPAPFPAVVMITGSGPQNRDEELLGFPVFRVIADHLTRRGIAVLRYDDRGGGGSTGSVARSTTSDFADDALAGIARLLERADIDHGIPHHSATCAQGDDASGGLPRAASTRDAAACVNFIDEKRIVGSESARKARRSLGARDKARAGP